MLKGRDLIGYAVNAMGGDKLTNLKTILEEISDEDLGELTRRAISLINPYNQYCFLEDAILGVKDCDNKIAELLRSYKIDIPIKYGWRHTSYTDGVQRDMEEHEWYNDRWECSHAMYKDAMYLLKNAIDAHEIPITITQHTNDRICFEDGIFREVYELYEM